MMTREEATKYAESKKMMLESLIYNDDCKYGNYAMYSAELSFINAALTALRPITREQVEKVWRGEWKPTESPYMNECEDCSVCGYRTPWGHGFRFCPACGAAQTDEAVQMVMERMETINNA